MFRYAAIGINDWRLATGDRQLYYLLPEISYLMKNLSKNVTENDNRTP
jgi:hypothetical protein